MIRLINRFSGTEMWVQEDKLAQFLAAGHTVAGDAPAPPEKPEKPKRKRKKEA